MDTPQKQAWEELVEKPEPSPDKLVASYLTHELRAPLTAIRATLSLLQERLSRACDPETGRMLDLSLKNTERLSSLIDDILDYTKIKSGKLTLRRTANHPGTLIHDAAEGLGNWAVSKGVRLVRVDPEEPLPRVLADPFRSVQVLVNILSNAIKFTPAGGKITVSAALGRREHAGTVVFSVKDTGRGIPAEDLERIFQTFEQSAVSGQRSDGTGLGLTIAKAMVEIQGGRIWAESMRGLGATFRFTLPVFHKDVAAPIEPYPQAIEYHGLLAGLVRRFNVFLAYFT